jgi:hypothetical protein
MPTKITGSFAGRIKTQASAVLNHESNHMLSLIEVIGVQKSPDPLWNGSKISYWGTADLVNGRCIQNHGRQRKIPRGHRDRHLQG